VLTLKPVGAKVREDVFKALVERAEAEGVTVSEIVRRAIIAYLGKPVEQPLEARLKELEARVARLEELLARQPVVEPTASGQARKPREGSEYVKTVSVEWASRRGLNIEEYMRRREREGYICNDTASHVICVWREELEQAVVELNGAKAKVGEVGKVLSGVRLEVAKAAEKAGLLWFDVHEGRWRI